MPNADFQDVFTRIRQLLLPYAKKMETRIDKEGNYQLYILGDIELAGRSFKECYFGGTTIKKTMVSFYFFPIYTHPTAFTIPAAIGKNLKGKSCFNFKTLDKAQEKGIASLLKDGETFYKKIKIIK